MKFTSNAREYELRCQHDFFPSNLTLKDLREVVPATAFQKSTAKGAYYVLRNVTMAFVFFKLATCIDTFAALLSTHQILAFGVRWTLWNVYWLFQGLAWGGFWTLGTCSRSIHVCVILLLMMHQVMRLGTTGPLYVPKVKLNTLLSGRTWHTFPTYMGQSCPGFHHPHLPNGPLLLLALDASDASCKSPYAHRKWTHLLWHRKRLIRSRKTRITYHELAATSSCPSPSPLPSSTTMRSSRRLLYIRSEG